jgi:hypothetical protein
MGARWIVVRTLLARVVFPFLLVALAFAGGIHATVGIDEAVRVGGDRLGDVGPSEREVVVGIDASGADRVPVAEIRAALGYWERQEAEYATAYDAEFLLRPNASDPDVLIRYRPGAGCAGGRPGCAPLVTDGSAFAEHPGPLEVRIDASHVPNRRAATLLLKHELGHVRGLGHCVEPRVVMGCPRTEAGEEASWETREHAWAKPTVAVYVAGPPNSTAVADALRRVERAPAAPPDLSFVRVGTRWEADLLVEVRRCEECDPRYETRFSGGRHYDDDGEPEFLTYAEVDVTAPDGSTQELVYEAASELAH